MSVNRDKSFDLLSKISKLFVGEKYHDILPACLFCVAECAKEMDMSREDLLEMLGKVFDLPNPSGTTVIDPGLEDAAMDLLMSVGRKGQMN